MLTAHAPPMYFIPAHAASFLYSSSSTAVPSMKIPTSPRSLPTYPTGDYVQALMPDFLPCIPL